MYDDSPDFSYLIHTGLPSASAGDRAIHYRSNRQRLLNRIRTTPNFVSLLNLLSRVPARLLPSFFHFRPRPAAGFSIDRAHRSHGLADLRIKAVLIETAPRQFDCSRRGGVRAVDSCRRDLFAEVFRNTNEIVSRSAEKSRRCRCRCFLDWFRDRWLARTVFVVGIHRRAGSLRGALCVTEGLTGLLKNSV